MLFSHNRNGPTDSQLRPFMESSLECLCGFGGEERPIQNGISATGKGYCDVFLLAGRCTGLATEQRRLDIWNQSALHVKQFCKSRIACRRLHFMLFLPDGMGGLRPIRDRSFSVLGSSFNERDFDRLIEACGRLASRGAQLSLVIVGHGPDRQQLHELAKECGIKHFEILPNQTQCSLNEIYRAVRCLCFSDFGGCLGVGG